MKRVAAGAALAVAIAGCSAREVCQDTDYGSVGAEPGGVALSSRGGGSRVLSEAGETETLRFDAHLSGLPELWQLGSAILSSSVTLRLSLRYETAPFGADGKTEMPVINARLAPFGIPARGSNASTSRFPGPADQTSTVELFPTCLNEGDPNCCPYGSHECTVPVTLAIERLDGSPFPPVVVTHAIAAEVRISTCPLGNAAPSLELRTVNR
jgi:hypothetical protein